MRMRYTFTASIIILMSAWAHAQVRAGGYVPIINHIDYQIENRLLVVNNNTPTFQIRLELDGPANHSKLKLFRDRSDHNMTWTVSTDGNIVDVYVAQSSTSINTVFQLTADANVVSIDILQQP